MEGTPSSIPYQAYSPTIPFNSDYKTLPLNSNFPSELKSSPNIAPQNYTPLRPQKASIQKLYQQSQQYKDDGSASQMAKSIQSELSEMSSVSNSELQTNIKTIERLWQYRYVCLMDNAIRTNEWFKLFSFICEFKEKCIELVKDMIHKGLDTIKKIDQIDHRFNQKGQGEEGIYLVEGIIVRIARVKEKKINGVPVFDHGAMKALHQEFLSLNILNNLSISLVNDMPKFPRIRVPLSCMVKYMGYIALCQADSPCQGLETLVHGPTGTIYQYRQEYMNLLRVIGHSLNLKQFTMLSSDRKSVTIPFSLTLELHKITKYLNQERLLHIIDKDSILYPPNQKMELDKPQFYLMSVAKLWPLFIDSDIIKSVGYLRPEVVISSRTPLSNVVFCEISQKPDPQGQLQLADACKRVKQDHISSLAKTLDNTTVFLVDSQGIQDLLHEYGINIRYIGSLAQKVNLQFNKRILETQMIARACKRYFFKTFQSLSIQQGFRGSQLLQRFKQAFVDFINLLFVKSKQGELFYRNHIYAEVQKYYDYKISMYPPEMPGGGILHALCYHFGVKIKIIDYPFFQDLDTIFNIAHILDVQGSAKCYDFDTAEIKQVCRKYKDKRKRGKIQQSIKELKILAKIHSVIGKEKTEPIGPLPQAYFIIELAEIYFKMHDVQKARYYAELALKSIPQKHSDAVRPFQILLRYYSQKKQINKGVEFYQRSLNFLSYHLGTNHPLTITVYNSFAYQQLETDDPSKCEKMFLKSLEICEHSLGYTHATSSQILLQLATLPLPPQKKINYYLQGLNVLQNLDTGDQHTKKVERVRMRIAEIYEKVGNLQKMIYFAQNSGYWQLKIKGYSKQQLHRKVLDEGNNKLPIDLAECEFLTFYCFRSYIKILSKQNRQLIYKLFVSIRDKISPKQTALQQFFKSLVIDASSSKTVTEQLKTIITLLLQELPFLILKPTFYRDITKAIDIQDRNISENIQKFMDVVSIVGQELAQKYMIENVKTYND